MTILYSDDLAEKLDESIKGRVEKLSKEGNTPCLAIVRVGENPNDISYEKGLLKKSDIYGIEVKQVLLDVEISTEELIAEIEKLNNDDHVTGVILFRPLPKHIDDKEVEESLDYRKDVDAMTSKSLAKVFQGETDGFQPATPYACMKLLEAYDIDLKGKNVAIIGRSMVLGKPLAMMMLNENATVTICHSRTKDLPEVTKAADIVVSATGRAKSVTRDYVNPDSIVVDVGVSADENGKLSGDADFEDLKDYVAGITPRTHGIGKITSTLLMDQVVQAKEKSLS